MIARALAIAAILIAVLPSSRAATLVTNFPWGTATIFDSGPLASVLSVRAQLGSDDESESLVFATAQTSPAVLETALGSGASALSVRSELGVSESNDSGMLFSGSAITLAPSGPGLGTAEVRVFLLIALDAPAVIQVLDLASAIAGPGLAAEAFSLDVSPSDAAGTVTGSPLLTFSGAYAPGAGGFIVGETPGFYRLDLRATAGPATNARTDFFFRFDLASIDTVPEPGVAVLAGAGIAVIMGHRWLRGRKKRLASSCDSGLVGPAV